MLVYGGARKGLMGVVSGAALEAGGEVTGVIPYAMVVSGGEKEQTQGQLQARATAQALFNEQNRKNVRRHRSARMFTCAHADLSYLPGEHCMSDNRGWIRYLTDACIDLTGCCGLNARA